MQHILLDFNLNNQSAKPSYFVHLYKILHSTMQMLSLIDSFHTLPSYSHAKSNLCKTQALAKCCKFLRRTTLRWKVSRVYAMVGCPSVCPIAAAAVHPASRRYWSLADQPALARQQWRHSTTNASSVCHIYRWRRKLNTDVSEFKMVQQTKTALNNLRLVKNTDMIT